MPTVVFVVFGLFGLFVVFVVFVAIVVFVGLHAVPVCVAEEDRVEDMDCRSGLCWRDSPHCWSKEEVDEMVEINLASLNFIKP